MRKVQVTVEGPLSGYSTDELDALGDAVMEALIDLGAEDPFVSIEGVRMWMRIELVVNASSGNQALAVGSNFIAKAMVEAGYEEVAGDELETKATTRVLELA